MSLTAAEVAEIMRLVEQSVFDELTLEFDGIKLNLRRVGAPPSSRAESTTITAVPASASVALQGPTPAPMTPSAAPTAAVDPALHNVVAPMLGTFYCAPKPGAPPFVQVGSVVEEGTVIAIIEVMKLMNSVRAGVCGTVTEIVGRDSTLVEYGETLLRVRKAPL